MEIDRATRAVLDRCGFDEPGLMAAAARLARGGAPTSNAVAGVIEAIGGRDLAPMPSGDSQVRVAFDGQGRKAIASGWIGAVLLAADATTAAALTARLDHVAQVAAEAGGSMPVWVLTTQASDPAMTAAIAARAPGPAPVVAVPMPVSLRLTPSGELFRTSAGELSRYELGGGDMPRALARAGVLDSFGRIGGRYLVVAHVDDPSPLEPAILGAHMYHGRTITAEVVARSPDDRGAFALRLDAKPRMLAPSQLPAGVDAGALTLTDARRYVMEARALRAGDPQSYQRIDEKIDGRPAVRFDQPLYALSAHLRMLFLQVDRRGRSL